MSSLRIYAYTGPGHVDAAWSRIVGNQVVRGVGRIKVGETTRPSARERIREQTRTMLPDMNAITIYIDELAVRADGTSFRDREVHRALVSAGVKKNGEWFEATLEEVKAALVAVRSGRKFTSGRTQDFPMRPEQEEAVDKTACYFRARADSSKPPHFLWNAKMRFGKTFTTYQLAREMGWSRVLVLTYKPAVQTAWKEDLESHADFSDWQFIDRSTEWSSVQETKPFVWFASFQDALGKTADGQVKERNEALHLVDWDCIVIDEYHFGAWRTAARDLYDPTDAELAASSDPEELPAANEMGLRAAHYLYLSGTPFRALTDGEFTEDAIFNWTYIDEQKAKTMWPVTSGSNPYAALPAMELYTYKIPSVAEAVAADGEFDGFDLSAYFKASKTGKSYLFDNPTEVAEFLNMLRGKLSDQTKSKLHSGVKPPFPFEDDKFVGRLSHTVWYLPDVAACFAMRDALVKHPYFKDFEVVVAAGDKAGQGAAAKPPVMAAIAKDTQSITLSCGKLMTGVTVSEWTGILMLRSQKSPESYFQAAFRVQSPWTRLDRTVGPAAQVLKPTCYVFDFDPNRALSLVAEYGGKLAATGNESPAEAIGELINYLPIFAFDGSSMEQLDASSVLDWATSGVGASMLARKWRSPLLVNLNEQTLNKLLAQQSLVENLEKMEDFRTLSNEANHIISSTKSLKKAKRENGGKLDLDQRKEQKDTAKRRQELRDKLLKFVSRVPVFMYLTDHREEALKDVIQSLDSDLFERVTGLTVDDFRLLNESGVFSAQHMNMAIYQFKIFEEGSLSYTATEVGLWDHSVSRDELALLADEQARAEVEGSKR